MRRNVGLLQWKWPSLVGIPMVIHLHTVGTGSVVNSVELSGAPGKWIWLWSSVGNSVAKPVNRIKWLRANVLTKPPR